MSELRDVLILVRRSASLLLAAAALGAALAGSAAWWNGKMPSGFMAVSLRFEGIDAAMAERLVYDGYYIIETERRFGELLAQALRRADIRSSFTAETGASIGRVERMSHADYRVEVRGSGTTDAVMRDVIERLLTQEMQRAIERSGELLRVSATATDPAFREPFSVVTAGAAGATLGLVLGTFFILLRQYFRSSRSL